MSGKNRSRRRVSTSGAAKQSHHQIPPVIEGLEARLVMSAYTVNTFVDQIDPYNSATTSLRDALTKAAAHAGADTINVPAGTYKLTQGELLINDASGSVTITGVGGLATLDAQSQGEDVIDIATSTDVVNLGNLKVAGAGSLSSPSDGAIVNRGTLTLHNSVISGNTGTGFLNSDSATLSAVTVSNDSNGIVNVGTLLVVNSTVANNQGVGITDLEDFSMYDSTIAGNGGMGISDGSSASTATLGNSIVALNNGRSADVETALVSKGGNVVGNAGTTAGWVSSDVLGDSNFVLDPMLAPLGNYGGLTPTMPPLGDGYALGSGVVSAIPTGTATDQRGLPRVISGQVDSGAVEVQRPAAIQVIPVAVQQKFTGGGTVNLGSFSAPGLSGPFVVAIHWGDGTPDTNISVASAGTIPSQLHKFAGSGIFTTTVAVTDGAGHLSNGADNPINIVPAPLTNIVVNTTADQTDSSSSKTVSLRDAILRADKALGPVSITFDPTAFAAPRTIRLVGSFLNIAGNPYGTTTIAGPASGVTINLGASEDFNVASGSTAVLNGVTLTDDPVAYDVITNAGNLTLMNSTITGVGQGIINTGTLTLTHSTMSGTPDIFAGSLSNQGLATIVDSTITGRDGVGIDNSGTAVVTDSTITNNYAGGIDNTNGEMLTLSNSIVAGNVSGKFPEVVFEVAGVVKSLGHNLIGDQDGSMGWISSDLLGEDSADRLDPKLSPLGYYGGPTQTQYPLPGSPALGAGSTSLIPSGATTDQRGFKRTVNGKVDIGAFQTQAATVITITPPAAQSAVAGTAKTLSLGSISDPGGSGPFLVNVAWGDGSPNSVFTVAAAGSLGTISHTFISTGALVSTITVVDHAGDLKAGKFTVNVAPAALKTIVVNTTADSNDSATSATVSLRDAIHRADAAFGPVNITFDPTVFASAKTIALTGALPDLQDNRFGLIDFIGPAAGVSVKSHLVYQLGGHGENFPTGNEFNVDSAITADFSNFSFIQLGFRNAGALTLVNSSITGNPVIGDGGGIYNSGALTLKSSTISGNDAMVDEAPGEYYGGDYGGHGGGIENVGTATIMNSTITGNSADYPAFAGIDNRGTITISDSTISGNNSGGINSTSFNGSPAPKATVANTIVAGNNGSDVTGVFTSSGHNLIGAKDGSSGWVSSDLTGSAAHPINAKLSPLGNYGGLTKTFVPLAGSPAIEAGSVGLIPSGVATDQRGLARTVGGKVDIGAVEIDMGGPYMGTTAPFGRIQAENFDFGGQNAAYFNPQNINKGGQYRPSEGVGISALPGGGYDVGFTEPGEWIDYTVNVAATGTYTLNFNVASGVNGNAFHLSVDGVNVTGSLAIPNKGWNTYSVVGKTGVHLTAGNHVLRLMVDSANPNQGNGNFDWFEAVKTA